MKLTKQHEMYMANAKILHLGPNVTYILLICVGVWGNANFKIRVGGNANFSVFGYQHVGISKAILWHWGSKPTPGPNVNGLASQWNIGFRLVHRRRMHLLQFAFPFRNCEEMVDKRNIMT